MARSPRYLVHHEMQTQTQSNRSKCYYRLNGTATCAACQQICADRNQHEDAAGIHPILCEFASVPSVHAVYQVSAPSATCLQLRSCHLPVREGQYRPVHRFVIRCPVDPPALEGGSSYPRKAKKSGGMSVQNRQSVRMGRRNLVVCECSAPSLDRRHPFSKSRPCQMAGSPALR